MERMYEVTKTGKSLMMHRDNLEWSGVLKRWEKDPTNRGKSIAGDDRSPAWRWIGSLYHDGEHVAIPADAVMACILGGGARVLVPNGRSGKTFKAQTQSGIVPLTAFWPVRTSSGFVKMTDVLSLQKVEDFDEHLDYVRTLGFELDVRRARVGQSKHVRVRPLFSNWSASGRLMVTDDQLTTDVLRTILREAGIYVGLLEWRPSAGRPGPFGTFTVDVQEVAA
jgi:hypothetical protein